MYFERGDSTNKYLVTFFFYVRHFAHDTAKTEGLLLRPRKLPKNSGMVLFNLISRRMSYLRMSKSDI